MEERRSDGLFGRSPQFKIVHIADEGQPLGTMVRARIESAGPNSLRGRAASGSLTEGSAVPIF